MNKPPAHLKGTTIATAATLAAAAAIHARYQDYNQKECQDSRRLVRLKHPRASDYEEIFAVYGNLAFACNSKCRLWFFHMDGAEPHVRIELFAPELTLTWYPTGKVSKKYSHVYPAMGEMWDKYIGYAARVKFDGAKPDLHTAFVVYTGPKEPLDTIRRLATERGVTIRMTPQGYRQHYIYYQTIEGFRLLKEVFTEAFPQGAGALPSAAEMGTGKPPRLPLAKCTLALGNVKSVVRRGNLILVPLVNPDESQGPGSCHAQVVSHADKLLALVLPYSTMRRWLAPRVPAELLDALDAAAPAKGSPAVTMASLEPAAA